MDIQKDNQMYMQVAMLAAQRSYAKRLKVGCVIVKNNSIISIGWNGMPTGYDNCCEMEVDGKLVTRPEVQHAELNAILNASGKSLRNARLYVDLFPCNECAKAIIQSGIREVIYLSDKYADTPATLASKRMLRSAGVTVRHLETELSSLTLDYHKK